MKTLSPVELLMIEDCLPDMELLKFLLGSCDVEFRFHCTYDGSEGSDFLFKRGKHASRPTPDLVLMDLNLPNKDGRELLREIKTDPELRKIPVVMLSTSNSQQEIAETYTLGASAFITKPPDLEVFQAMIHSLVDFWFKHAILPSRR